MYTPRRSIRNAWLAMLGLALFASTGAALADDPPDRVARLSYLRGEVSFQPSGVEEWTQASLNRPLGTGDRIYTDRDSRTEMEIGAATLRLDQQSSFDLLNLDDNVAQVELTEGVMNVHVRRVFEGQTYEVDTPTLAFVINQPGDYRIDIAPDGSSSMITVFRGAGDVYGENNASYSVHAGQSYRFRDTSLSDYEVLDLPRADDFDGWVDSRNNRYQNSPSRSYVSEDVIGYADLDDYGGWSDVPDYGHVWYPTNVAVGWAPYRSGHWSWIDPWGWTWVDTAAWGFAPFHYGRWAYVGNRWGWCPGPVNVRPIYAPALVAFVGGAGWGVGVNVGGPVGWFPLGPRDVYVPWYGASQSYFTNVNVHNTTVINNVNITNVYNNYSNGRPIDANYAYGRNTAAVTAVSRETFVGARSVNAARVKVNEGQLRNANVVSRVGIAPERASFVSANATRARAPSAQTLDRKVIARTQPPARAVPASQRIDAIKRNGDQPLSTQQLRQASARTTTGTTAKPNQAAQRVQVVGNNATKPQPLPARAPANTANTANRAGPNDRTNPANGRTSPNAPANTANTRTPPQGTAPQRGSTEKPSTAQDSRSLPSSRFAPRNGQTTPTDRTSSSNSKPNTREAPASTNQRTAPTSRNEPATRDSTPSSSRTSPSNASPNRNAPTEQRTTTPSSSRKEPSTQRSSTPPQGNQRSAPTQQQQRSAPTQEQKQRSAPTQQQPRSAPAQQQQQRSAPTQQQQRSAPTQQQQQQRSAPTQQQQQRSAPAPQQQQRSAPPPQQQRSAPVQQQPQQQRRPPPERTKEEADKEEKDKDGRGR
ncbi:MAG: DUF6600 domain-containing protein [Rhodanobacteraceae bacterium]